MNPSPKYNALTDESEQEIRKRSEARPAELIAEATGLLNAKT